MRTKAPHRQERIWFNIMNVCYVTREITRKLKSILSFDVNIDALQWMNSLRRSFIVLFWLGRQLLYRTVLFGVWFLHQHSTSLINIFYNNLNIILIKNTRHTPHHNNSKCERCSAVCQCSAACVHPNVYESGRREKICQEELTTHLVHSFDPHWSKLMLKERVTSHEIKYANLIW